MCSGRGLGEKGEDVGACGWFLRRCHAVFQVVGYGVYCKTAGLFEEFGGGGGDCLGVRL